MPDYNIYFNYLKFIISLYIIKTKKEEFMKKTFIPVLMFIVMLGLSFICIHADNDTQGRITSPSKTLDEILQSKCMTILGAEDPESVIETILGEGIVYSNVMAQGIFSADPSEASIGFFSGADCVPLGFDEGIILSSGTVGNAMGPNESSAMTAVLGLPGDPDLEALIPGFSTYDASWIQFDFIPEDSQIFIQYVFGSEEYNQYVDSSFNDVFGFFVNGENIALLPGTDIPVAINNVNNGFASSGQSANGPCTNCEFYRDNADLANPPYYIECDGMTTVLTATATVNPGEINTIKIAIADAGDASLDSWVFIKAESFSVQDPHLQLTPKTGNALVYTEHCWEALYLDQFNEPVTDAEIEFIITGPNSESSGSAFTNDNGVAVFCYTGLYEGTDTITAQINSLSDSAVFTWEGLPAEEFTVSLFSEPEDLDVILEGAGTYEEETEVHISASIAKGFIFSGWTGEHAGLLNDAGSETTFFIMPDHDVEFTAVYEYVEMDLVPAIISLEHPIVEGIWKWEYSPVKSNFMDPENIESLDKNAPWSWTKLITGFSASKIIVADITGNGNLEIIMDLPESGLGYYDLTSGSWTVLLNACFDFTVAKACLNMPKQIIASYNEGIFIWDFDALIWIELYDVPADIMISADLTQNGLDELAISLRGHDMLYVYDFLTGELTSIVKAKPSQMLAGDLTGDGMNDLVCSFDGYGIYLLKFPEGFFAPGQKIDLMQDIQKSNEWAEKNNMLIQRIIPVNPNPDHIMAIGDIDYDDALELIVTFGTRTYYYSYTNGWKTLVFAPIKRSIAGKFTGHQKDDLIICESTNNNIYLRHTGLSSWQLIARGGNTNAMSPYDWIESSAITRFTDLSVSNWENWTPRTGQWSITEGNYSVTRDGYNTSTSYFYKNFSNFEFEVKLRKTAGGNCGVGIIFHGDPDTINDIGDWDRYYQLYYCTQGTWNLALRIAGEIQFIQPWTYSPDLNLGVGAWNILKVIVANGHIDVFINGVLQGTYFDNTFTSGKIGVKMYDQFFAGEAEFDYVSLIPLSRTHNFGKIDRDSVKTTYFNANENCHECADLEIKKQKAIIPPYGLQYTFIPETGSN